MATNLRRLAFVNSFAHRITSILESAPALTLSGSQQKSWLSSAVAFPTLPKARYGGRQTVTVLPGDGTGPELMGHVQEVFRYACVPVDFEEVKLDHTSTDQEFDNAILAIKRNGVALKGNVESGYKAVGFKSKNVELRAELDLFANVVWCKSCHSIPTRHKGIDLIIIRENTEGEYSQLEHESVPGVVESMKIITARRSARIANYAFDFAAKHGRKKVTAIHKANIMKLGDGLFLESCRKVSERYPGIKFDSMIVDNCTMQLVSNPHQFDVMVLPNLYGNIVANIGAGLVGGPGIPPGLNIGEHYAVFETGTRNTGKNIAGKNIVNPTAMLLASADMLDHLQLNYFARIIKEAVYTVLDDVKYHTPDIGGKASTSDVVQAVVKNIQTKIKWKGD